MTATYRFGTIELQPDQRRLLVDGQPASLGPRAFDVLLALVERSGQLVSKSQLFDPVWPGVIVEENNLQVQISSLRKLLGPENGLAASPSSELSRVIASLRAALDGGSTTAAA